MSFLDDVPQDWSKPELRALRDLFVLAFRRPAQAEHLAEESGIVPGTFPIAENMRAIWTELIRVMGNQQRLRILVEKAAQESTTTAYGQRFSEMLQDHPTVPAAPPQPGLSGAWWKGGDEPPELHLQRLMERRSRLIDLELAAGVVRAAASVARLTLRFGPQRAYGTGFLIGPDMVLTNHHNTEHPKYGRLTSVVAEFDHDRTPRRTRLVRQVEIGLIDGDKDDDWAVMPLRDPADRPPLSLGSPFDVDHDDLVVIIQHPLGTFKQFALQPLAVRHVSTTRIQYVADTQNGSSGSPVFNEQMHVIALHQADITVAVSLNDRRSAHLVRDFSGITGWSGWAGRCRCRRSRECQAGRGPDVGVR